MKNLVLVSEETDEVSSSKPYFALIYWLINDYKREKSVEKEFKGQIEKLMKIANDCDEGKEYLINEIQELTGE